MKNTVSEIIFQEGKTIARANVESEPAITEVLLFPSDDEIRIVEIDTTAPPSGYGRVCPFYFSPSPGMKITHPSGIALITPEEKGSIELPEDWGSWSDAVTIWPE